MKIEELKKLCDEQDGEYLEGKVEIWASDLKKLIAVAEAAKAFDSYEPRDPARIALRAALAALEAE